MTDIGGCLLSNEPPDMAEGMINRRIQGKSWGEIATEFGFPNPSAARKAYTKATGITDYKIKGKELQDLVNKGLLDTIKGTVEKKAKKAVAAVDDALNIARKGPDVFDMHSYNVAKVREAQQNLVKIISDPLNPPTLVSDVLTMNGQGHGYLMITKQTNATFADVDNIIWNSLVDKNNGDIWKAYVSKPTSESGYKAVKEVVFELRGKGMTLQEIADVSGIDKNVAKLITEGNWSLPVPGAKSYVGKHVPQPTSTYTTNSNFSGSYNGQKYIPPDHPKPNYTFQPDPYDPRVSSLTNYEARSVSEMDDWHNSLGYDLSGEQLQAIKDYTGAGYDSMNGYLRGSDPFGSDYMKANIDYLDSSMRPIPEPQQVYRGVNMNVFQGEDPSSLVGTVFTDPGYMSTTNQLGRGFTSKQVVLKIDLPPGTPARWVQPYSNFKSEQEVLLGRGMNFLVKSIENNGNQLIVHMEAIL
jgi:ADP-ribosyltransferase exoenzyme